MYAVTQSYLDAVRASSRTDRLTGVLRYPDGTEVELTESLVSLGTVSIEKSCVEGEELQFGAVILGQLKLSLMTDTSRYAFFDAVVKPVYGVLTADGSWEDIPLGEYTVGEAERKNRTVQLVCYDNLLALNKTYGGAALYGTPYEISVMICENCGVRLGMTEDEFLALPNGAEIIQIDETSGCETYRDAMKILGQMTGTFVIADSTGAIALRQFGKAAVTSLGKTHRYSLTAADYVCNYMGLKIKSSTKEFESYDVDIASGLEMTINDAPAWDYGMDDTLQARADTLLAELTQIVYTPSTMVMPGDPAIECGDLLELVTDDGVVNTLVTEITWKFRGKMNVSSAGVNPYLKGRKTQKTQIIRQLEKQTEENKLIFYSFTNQNDITAKDEEPVEISQVTFVTTQPTSAMFIAQLPLTVEAEDSVDAQTTTNETEETYTVEAKDSTGASTTIMDANGNPITLSVVVKHTDTDTVKTIIHGYVDVQIEYYLMGTLVDYELVQRLPAGRHILALFYTFDALDGDSNYQWQVKIKVVGGSGTVTVPKRAFRATVTGQGMAGTEIWDGTLSFDESVSAISMASKLSLVSVTEEITTETQIPTPASIEEAVATFSIRSGMTLVGFTERVSTTEIREKKSIDTAEWEYNERYVTIENNSIMARVSWQYESEEQSIDSGRMTVVKAVTSDLASVEEVEVSG